MAVGFVFVMRVLLGLATYVVRMLTQMVGQM